MPTWTVPCSTTARRALVVGAGLLFLAATPGVAAADAPPSFTIDDPRITESSGLAASTRHPDVYWTHNDQDPAGPNVYAVDGTTGETVATVTLQGVEARDMEAISLGPDGDVYVGDIGDNFDGGWSEVWIYRFPEPAELADTTVTPTVYTVVYDDGPRDAEALMVHPVTGRVYIASKKDDGTAALYAGPAELSAEGVNTFERTADLGVWVTDGAFSPDGSRLMLRGYFVARMFRWTDAGPEPIDRSLFPPVQQQGESVTFTPDGRTLMFGTEGAGSGVEPVELEGELLPDSARDEDAAAGDGEGRRDGTGGGDAAAGDPDGEEGSLPLPLVAAVVGGVALLAWLLRLGRGGGGRRRGGSA
ncbi:hypothetical protein [Streptomyces hainanensis]|uniref:hypothetical protein n=1 Tax=Streptomyces hainanensis TaxID=402648 RepID=UPI001404FF45|nr:hypothetical protein [Streptomyces hainanensis]